MDDLLIKLWGFLHEAKHKKTGNGRINRTMRRVRVTTDAVEKQYLLHILSTSVVVVIQHAMRMCPITACPAKPYFST
jgi:hypothetical protein